MKSVRFPHHFRRPPYPWTVAETCLPSFFFLLFLRNLALFDKEDRLVKGSQEPTLQLVTASIEDHRVLCLDAPGMDTLKVNLDLDTKEVLQFR